MKEYTEYILNMKICGTMDWWQLREYFREGGNL